MDSKLELRKPKRVELQERRPKSLPRIAIEAREDARLTARRATKASPLHISIELSVRVQAEITIPFSLITAAATKNELLIAISKLSFKTPAGGGDQLSTEKYNSSQAAIWEAIGQLI